MFPPFLPLLLLGIIPWAVSAQSFFFDWPDGTAAQCDVVDLTWQNGTSPFRLFVVPIYGEPFIYDIPDTAYTAGNGSYPVQLQLNQGSSYVVFMSDANGIGSGGSSEAQFVTHSATTTCLQNASQNQTSLDFTFSVSGVTKQCYTGFDLSWSGGQGDGPYNFTVVPLDQSFRPFDVPLKDTATVENDWQLNVTAGANFTVMMNSKNGYGRGGVAGVYRVASSDRSACVSQPTQSTGVWPNGLVTNTLASATNSPSTTSDSSGSGLSGGAIGGIVVGALAAVLIVLALLWFLLRRRRRRNAAGAAPMKNEMDLTGGGGGSSNEERAPMVEPYRANSLTRREQAGPVSDAAPAGIPGLGLADVRTSRDRKRPDSTADGMRSASMGGGRGEQSNQSVLSPGETQMSDLKTETIASMAPTPANSGRVPAGQEQNLRLANPDGSVPNSPSSPVAPPERREGYVRGPTFRRHEDAGRVQEVVDLPPLYSDVPRDEVSLLGRSRPT